MFRYYVVRILAYSSICAILMIGIGFGVIWHFKEGLPSFDELEDVDPARTTNIYSADGKILKKFWVQRRDPITYDQLPQAAIDGLISTEDQHFWRHWGVSISDIFRVVIRNVWVEGRLKGHGASTITQQLARHIFLTQDQTWTRKIQEQLTAVLLERTYTKREIIEKYFNRMLFGRGAHGIEAAARRFFGKRAKEMSIDECALLVGLLKGPYYYSPVNHPQRAKDRRNLVLRQMFRAGYITPSEYRSARLRPIVLKPLDEATGDAPYFTEHVRQYIERTYGLKYLYKDGVSVLTTLDSRVQQIAEEELEKQLEEVQRMVDERRRRNPPDSTFWAGIDTRADTLAASVVQGAFVALDPHTGHILAMVGGRNFNESKFNRAIQALRQPGSSFKPFVYTAALDKGLRPTLRIPDTAVSIPMADGTFWQPENYDRKFLGWLTMREGLYMSRNVVTTQILQKIGPRTVVAYAKKLGIKTRLRPYLSLAMGTSEVTLIDMVSAYGTYPNKGIHVDPIAIMRIIDKDGETLEDHVQGKESVALSAETAAVVVNMLQSVMDKPKGTGYHGARRVARFRRPAAGKTGTTQNFADSWFVGFTPQIVAGVWVGFDAKVSLGDRMSGAVVALPVWARFMKRVHEVLELPVENFVIPESVPQLDVCDQTYEVATIYCPKPFKEAFLPGTEPSQTCPKHASRASTVQPAQRRGRKDQKRKGFQF
jgi:penicillin-binding protein 1A